MKGKKLVSILTAGALAATMAMPAMADGGEVNVDVTTKTGILRVEVPTTLAIAVDQFETSDVGSQVYSGEFTIANRSEVNVKVNVTSTATVESSVTLAAKRADVAAAAGTNGTAWLAVAAKKSANNYEAASGNDSFANLNEASANVTTFAKNGTAITAAQTFYLKKGQANSAAYKLLKPEADGKNNDVSYAQFYKLTEIGTQPTDTATLQAAVNASDVYEITSANQTAPDGKSVTKIEKGDTATFTSGSKYYTIAEAPTPIVDLKAADIYAYGELTKDADDADAAFRYIGALSSNKEVWDSKDISKINIAYTIQGIPQSTYDDAVAETGALVYGLYKGKIPATYSKISGVNWVSLNAKDGFAAAPTSVSVGGTELASGKYTFEKSGWIKLVDDPAAGDEILVVVNGTTYKATVPTS